MSYIAVVHLVKRPPATRSEWMKISEIAYTKGESIVGSADDARKILTDVLPGSVCNVWYPEWWGGLPAISEYLGVPCEAKYLDTPIYWSLKF